MPDQNEPQQPNNTASQPLAEEQTAKKKSTGMPVAIKVIIIILVVLVAIFLVLFLTAWIAGFDSIAELVNLLGEDLGQIGSDLQSNAPPSLT